MIFVILKFIFIILKFDINQIKFYLLLEILMLNLWIKNLLLFFIITIISKKRILAKNITFKSYSTIFKDIFEFKNKIFSDIK